MPSPLAHPAAAVPFTKAGMVFSALVIGSIAPDFWYIIRVGPSYFAYTLTGLLLFDVPVGLVLLMAFPYPWPSGLSFQSFRKAGSAVYSAMHRDLPGGQ